MQGYLDQIVLVLYQPTNIVNVAAIIRVMSNFGLRQLRLVEPAAYDPYRIAGIAHHTENIIGAVGRFATLEEAVADCGFILGTSGKPRAGERSMLAPREAAPLLLQAAALAPDQKVAVLFGTEQDGLPNEALDQCHGVLTIPTHPDNMSLNLAQAALVIAYELWMAASAPADQPATPAPAAPSPDLAGGEEREALFAALRALLVTLYPASPESRVEQAMSRLRTMLMRSAPRREEAAALTNLCRHAARMAAGASRR